MNAIEIYEKAVCRLDHNEITVGEFETEIAMLKDVETVVRCCDCVSCKVILDNVGAGHWHCKKRYGLPEVDPTDFCSHGERRQGE